jgi:branched-chain amino acid transport system substrate-binding protein
MVSNNPFNTGSPARGEGFLGRQEIFSSIVSFLKKKDQLSLLIFGQRRIGKTSLLRKLQDDVEIRKTAFPVYFNLQDKARVELHRLLFEIAKRIISDLDLTLDLNTDDFKSDNASFYFINNLISMVIERLPREKQVLLLFDEFDVLGAVEDVEDDSIMDTFAVKRFIPFTADLLGEIQAKEYPVKFIFAVGRNYKDLEPKRFGQIMKFGPQEELSYFSKEETRKLLKASDNVIPFDAEAVDEIYSLTFGHPYFTQCLAGASFDAAEKNKARGVSRDIVRRQFISAVKSYGSGVYWIWDSLSAEDRVILYLMAVLKEENVPVTVDSIHEKAASLNVAPVVENILQTMDKLKAFKFVKDDKQGEYDFFVEFIRKWIVKEISEEEIVKLTRHRSKRFSREA